MSVFSSSSSSSAAPGLARRSGGWTSDGSGSFSQGSSDKDSNSSWSSRTAVGANIGCSSIGADSGFREEGRPMRALTTAAPNNYQVQQQQRHEYQQHYQHMKSDVRSHETDKHTDRQTVRQTDDAAKRHIKYEIASLDGQIGIGSLVIPRVHLCTFAIVFLFH